MTANTAAHILGLVTTALDELESVPVPATLRRALRIARLRGDVGEEIRFSLELGLQDATDVASRRGDELESANRAASAYLAGRRRRVDPANLDVEDLEVYLQQPIGRFLQSSPSYETELSLTSRIEHRNRQLLGDDILATVRNDAFSYLLRCETALRLSVVGESAFDKHRASVDRLLESMAPDVLAMFNSAYDRAADTDDSEAIAHALTSCRRILEAVADLVFPARAQPFIDGHGTERAVGQGQYRNRIIAAIEIAQAGTHGRALSAAITDFSARLDRLDALTQRGVHENASREDVDFGVVQTYLLAGEVLTICSPEDY